jgi:hypothetical protein
MAYMTRRRIALTLLGVGVLGAVVWPLVHATEIKSDAAAVWLTTEGVLVAAIALFAALAAAVFAYPAFRDWTIAQPRPNDVHLSIWAASAQRNEDLQFVQADEPHDVTGGTSGMYVRVAVHNDGRGVVRAGLLNIMVPAEWQIRPDDDPHVGHYRPRGVAGNAAIEPGRVTEVRFTVARDDFPPGTRMFHVQIDGPIPDGAKVNLLAELDGTGLQHPVVKVVTLIAR